MFDRSRRAKKIHPADLADMRDIARATHFVAFFRKSPLEAYRESADDIDAARGILAALEREHGGHGRRGVVYAITPEKKRVMVPNGYGATA